MIRNMRKPLICITPKSLLRHKLAISTLEDLSDSTFKPIIYEKINDNINRVIFCSGKVFYDLYEQKEKLNIENILLVRLEQLYPFPDEEILDLLSKVPNSATYIWCQEEPYNQGACDYIKNKMYQVLKKELIVISRPESASPAVGYVSLHNLQQKELINKALGVF
jgi:2-oxoglutarate dehydrogenase E1 component